MMRLFKALALGSALVAGVARGEVPAVAPSSGGALQGVWKIAVPSTALKPVSGAIPFTAEGRKKLDANMRLKARRAFNDFDTMTARCSNPGVPRLMLTPMRFKLWQQQGVVTFDFEWNRAIRQIDMTGMATEPPLVPTVTGVSKGHWDGDTLVAVTTDLAGSTLLDDVTPHGDDTKITEHLRLVDPDTLEDRITVEDPKVFSRPWDAVIRYKRQPDALFPQDVCLDRLDAKQPAVPAR